MSVGGDREPTFGLVRMSTGQGADYYTPTAIGAYQYLGGENESMSNSLYDEIRIIEHFYTR